MVGKIQAVPSVTDIRGLFGRYVEQTFLSLSSSIISQPKNKSTFSDFNGLRFLRVVMLKEVLSNNNMKGAHLNLIITIFNIHLFYLCH